ncbi:MAG: efflux RND transporter periplasmic adaptor subunit [Alkalispirochaeta sp.]
MKTTTYSTRVLMWALAVPAAFAVLLLLSGCSRPSGDAAPSASGEAAHVPERQPVAVRVQHPEYRTLENRISYVGTVFASQEVPIVARVQGTLVELPVAEGDAFRQGEVIARLESPEMEAAVERLSAEVDYWDRRHDTDLRLVEQEALAPEQADASERALRTARAGLSEAEAQLAKTVVTAPFDGTVLDWTAEAGQPVMPGQRLALIGDATREIRVDVVEEDLARGIKIGTAVYVSLTPGDSTEAQVAAIAPTSSGPARTFSVTLPISPSEDLPRKGASIRVEFILNRRDTALAVPTRAVADPNGTPHIFVVRDDTAYRHDVDVGITEGAWTAVSFDWDGSSAVALTNLAGLQHEQPVYAVATEGKD